MAEWGRAGGMFRLLFGIQSAAVLSIPPPPFTPSHTWTLEALCASRLCLIFEGAVEGTLWSRKHSQLRLLFQELLQELHLQICGPEQLRTESPVSLLAPFTLLV